MSCAFISTQVCIIAAHAMSMFSAIRPLGSLGCRQAFQPFVDEGYLAFVYGGGEEGKYLCNNPAVQSIHLTGSEATYDAIVWGPGKPKVCLLLF